MSERVEPRYTSFDCIHSLRSSFFLFSSFYPTHGCVTNSDSYVGNGAAKSMEMLSRMS